GHRVNVTGVRIEDDDRSALRTVLLDGRPQVLLSLELEISVDGEDDAAPRLGVLDDLSAPGDLLALGGELDGALSWRARQELVVLALEPGGPDPVDVHVPQDLGRHGPRGVVALRHRQETDPGQVEVRDVLRDVEVDLAFDIGERSRRGQRRPDGLVSEPEHRYDLRRFGRRVDHEARVRIDVARVEGQGHRHAASVQHLSANGRKGFVVHALGRSELRVGPRFAHLEHGEPDHDAAYREHHGNEHDHQTMHGRALHAPSPDGSDGTRMITTRWGITIPSF